LYNVADSSDLFSLFIFSSRVNYILLSRFSVSVTLKSGSRLLSCTATCSSSFQTERLHGSAFSDQTSIARLYSKTCLKRNAIVPVFFSPVFTGFRFTKGCVLIKQSTKNMIA